MFILNYNWPLPPLKIQDLNERSALQVTGEFEILTGGKYLNSDTYLKRGDILPSSVHTAIVLSKGSNAGTSSGSSGSGTATTVDPAQSLDKSLAGKYQVTASALNVRTGAGTAKSSLGMIPKGENVQCRGYYTQSGICAMTACGSDFAPSCRKVG